MDVTSPAIVNEIRAALVRSFAPVSLDILDDSARHAGHAGARAGGHFRVTLVSTAFAGECRGDQRDAKVAARPRARMPGVPRTVIQDIERDGSE